MGIVSRIINKITGKKETKTGDVGNIQSGSGAPTQKVYYTPTQVATATKTGSVTGTTTKTSGGGGGSSYTPKQTGSITVTQEEAKTLGKTTSPVTVVQSTPSASTSATQVQAKAGPQPNTISASGPLSSYAGTYRRSYWDATKQSVKDIGTNIKYGATGTGAYFNPFRSFEATGSEKSEQVAYYKPNFGTIQTTGVDMNTGNVITTGAFTPITFLDIQKGVESKDMFKEMELTSRYSGEIKNIQSSYQGRIDAGEDYSKVTEEFESVQKEKIANLNKEFQEFKITNPDVQGFTTRSGKGLVQGIPMALETGALVGVSTLGGPVGLGVASAYTLGKGFEQTVTAPTWVGKSLGVATVGLSLAGIGSATRGIERSILQGELASLSTQPIKFKQIQIVSGDKSLVGFTATQTQGGLTRTITGRGVGFMEGTNMFVVPKGSLKVTTSGSFGWNYYTGASKTNIFAVNTGVFGSKSAFTQRGEFLFSAGKSTFVPKSSMSAIYGLDVPRRTIMGYSTSIKLGGDSLTSFSFSSSKIVSPDTYGNQRFFSAGFGLKDMKIVKPAQFGITTVIDAPSGFRFGGGLADDIGGSFGGGGFTRTVARQNPTLSFDTGLVSGSVGKTLSDSLSTTKVFVAPITSRSGSVTTPTTKISLASISMQSLSSLQTLSTQKSKTRMGGLLYPTSSTGRFREQTKVISPVRVTQSQRQPLALKQLKAFPSFTTPTAINPNIPFDFNLRIPFKFPSFLGSDASGGLGKIKAQRTYRYTPSFGALALKGQRFKIGETTTKRFTGLEFRGTKQKKKKTRSIFGFKF